MLFLLSLLFLFSSAQYRSVVLWHGMGDSCCDPLSMGKVQKTIENALPGIYVYSVEVGNSTEQDIEKSFFDNANRQVEEICGKIKSNPKLQEGFNAVGFSQGGQLLRAYVQRCNDPPVYNLVTMGGQHEGVADFPGCVGYNTTLCEDMADLLGIGAYKTEIQEILIQAQYFKNPLEFEWYLNASIFLADINNERDEKNATYKKNLITLNKLALFEFENDTTVVPKESSWFGYWNGTDLLKMQQQQIYTEDWIGLQTLDQSGRIDYGFTPGAHMQFTMDWFTDNVINVYLNNKY